jgi:hypothetical protein
MEQIHTEKGTEQILTSFMLELATDPRKLAAYWQNRVAYLATMAFSFEVREALLSGDHERVEKLLGAVLNCPRIVTGGIKHTKKDRPKKKKKKKVGRKAAKKSRDY